MTSEFTVAVHALVYLNHRQEHISSEVLAKNVCTNPARIRKVLAKLKKAGFVATKEGIDGGYRFLREPQEIDLRQVADALEVRFVNSSWKSGDEHMECLIASGMSGILDGIYGELDQACRQRLERITIADIDRQIFGS